MEKANRQTIRSHRKGSPVAQPELSSTEELLFFFYKFSLVLGLLKKISEVDAKVKQMSGVEAKGASINDFRGAFGNETVASLFGRANVETSHYLSKAFWKRNFEGRESHSATVYDCRNFYATDSPNNLQERFKKLVANTEPRSSKIGRPSISQHDQHIRDWGYFAESLVDQNGGWLKLLSKNSLGEVADIWKRERDGQSGWELNGLRGDDQNSFIQRVMSLAGDRYIQILTSTAAPMWSLWFLKDDARRETLGKILERQNKNFHVGRSLPNSEIFIDVNTRPGFLEGFPFPFGYADKALQLKGATNQGVSWSSREIDIVAKSLVSSSWCPPLLFGGRGDQWVQPHDPSQNLPVPYIALGSHTKFGAVYLSNARREELSKNEKTKAGADKASRLDDLCVAFEPNTWGDFALKKIRHLKGLKLEKTKSYDRREMLSDFDGEGVDVILSYFPVDAFLNVSSEKFTQLEPKDTYRFFGDCGEHLIYDLPSTILAGGTFLSRQPKMSLLIEHLARYLYKIEAVFRHLLPAWDSDVPNLLRQAKSEDLAERRAAANILSILCKNAVNSSNIYKDVETRENAHLKPEQIEKWAKDMSYEMAESVAHDKSTRSELKVIFEDWQWILILQSIRNMQVFISCDLFSAERTSI